MIQVTRKAKNVVITEFDECRQVINNASTNRPEEESAANLAMELRHHIMLGKDFKYLKNTLYTRYRKNENKMSRD